MLFSSFLSLKTEIPNSVKITEYMTSSTQITFKKGTRIGESTVIFENKIN